MRVILATLHSKFVHNSLALPSLAAFCGPECGQILIREFTVHEPRGSILSQLLLEKPDVIALSVYLWNRTESLELIDALAMAKPGIRLVVGGPEVSFDGPELFAIHPGLTALIRGEGELPLRALLAAWSAGISPEQIPRLTFRHGSQIIVGPDGPLIENLDCIPSPFQLGLVALDRGIVYYETSRGCPYECCFCLSGGEGKVRSYSMKRIKSDLLFLIKKESEKVKLVDRTFNFQPKRAKEIWAFLLEHNISSRFHFEIAAHLIDSETLSLLKRVPNGMFQFEIGVQSMQDKTLKTVRRNINMNRLGKNIRALQSQTKIHLHLDLVAGLPKEGYQEFLESIDRVFSMAPHHLQIEPVKLLPGSPLRQQADQQGFRYDPNPPYTVLTTQNLSFEDLTRLQNISRMIDLTYNARILKTFITCLAETYASFAKAMEQLAEYWQSQGWLRFPCSRKSIFERCYQFVCTVVPPLYRQRMTDALAYDYAKAERVVLSRVPEFFDLRLKHTEQEWSFAKVREKTELLKGKGGRLQHFTAVFKELPGSQQREVRLFVYLTRPGKGICVEEYIYPNYQPIFARPLN